MAERVRQQRTHLGVVLAVMLAAVVAVVVPAIGPTVLTPPVPEQIGPVPNPLSRY